MNKLVLIGAMFAAVASFADSYKWTGAVSSDFADAGNWLVKSGDEWIATETPPANTYGVDTVVFDGDAESCPNQPVISTDYIVRDLKFLTSGWTISGAGSLRLNHCYGGTDYHVDGVQRPNIAQAVVDESGAGTNTIATTFHVTFGYTFNISEGSVLAITGATTCDNGPGNNLGSNAKHSQLTGGGTLLLGGVGSAAKLTEKYMEVVAGTLVLGRTSDGTTGVAALSGPLHVRGTGKVVYLADNQVADDKSNWWMLGGNGSIDFGGYAQTLGRMALGVAANDQSVAGDWTGEIKNSMNVKIGTANSNSDSYGYLQVNTNMSHTVLLEDGLSTNCGRYNGNNNHLRICAGDNPDLDVELAIEGSMFYGRSGNLGVPVHYTKSALSDGTYGAIALGCVNGSVGQYAKVFVETALYVNANTNSTGSLGAPKTIEVTAGHGVLRGDGLVTPYTGSNKESVSPTIDVFGAVAPGSIAHPNGTLTIQRSYAKNSVATTMHTNSILRIEADANGDCPKVVQNDGTFTLEQPGEGSGDEISAPKIVIAGANAPTLGRHRILSVTGTLTGEFAPEVELVGFPRANSYSAKVYYTTDGNTTHVDVSVSKQGMTVIIR